MTAKRQSAENVIVRPISLGDWPAIVAMRNDLNAHELAGCPHAPIQKLSLQEFTAHWGPTLEDPHYCWRIIEAGARAVGFGLLYLLKPKVEPVGAFVHWAYVEPGRRRTGMGKQLMDHLLEWARTHNVQRIELQFIDGNEIAERFNVHVHGSLTAAGSSTLSAGGTVFLQGPDTPGPNTTVNTGDSLLISANIVDITTSVTVLAGGALTFVGVVFKAQASSTINMNTGSFLGLTGSPALLVTVHGVVNMATATITATETFILDNGTLNSLGSETINGDLAVVNTGTLNLGTALLGGSTLTMATGSLTVGATGPDLSSTGGTVNMYAGATLSFPAAASASTFTIKGDVNMYGALISTNPGRVAAVDIRGGLPGGELNSLAGISLGGGGSDSVSGNVTNAGNINVGTAAGVISTLYVSGATSSSGQVNIHQGGTFWTVGTVSVSGGVDMYGAALVAGGGMSLSGTLSTHGGSSGPNDSITTGLLTNTGTIRYLDLVHILALTGGYTQGSSGNLQMRLANGQVSDELSLGGTATLAGTLRLTGIGTLADNQVWTIITAGAFVGNFAAPIFYPDGDPGWSWEIVGGSYRVDNIG